MSNTSASGGYLVPTPLVPTLNLTQFIQMMLVGISALPGNLVRPKWQIAPPKNPPLDTDWLAFGVVAVPSDANAYVYLDEHGVYGLQRHEGIIIQCAFYGPNSLELSGELRDGFQIQQNLEAMRAVNMGFVSTETALHIPELVNERFVDRIEMGINLRREIQRVYPILSFTSASGSIKTVLKENEEVIVPWAVTAP